MGMIDAEVAVAEVDQAVIAAPAEGRILRIGVDDGAEVHPAADDALQGWLRTVGNDLSVDLALALEAADPKSPSLDDGLAIGTASAPALDPTRPEKAFIDLDDTEQGALRLAFKQNAFPQTSIEPVHGVAVQTAQRRRLEGRRTDSTDQIGGEVTHQLADLAQGRIRRADPKSSNASRTCFSLPSLALSHITRPSARQDPCVICSTRLKNSDTEGVRHREGRR